MFLLTGCGTMCTAMEDGKGCAKLAPYSGTKAAAQGHGTQWDIPFSLVADTLLLPITIPKAILDSASTKEPENSEKSEPSKEALIKSTFPEPATRNLLICNEAPEQRLNKSVLP